MRSLIPENINSKLDEIVTECFALNRLCDRAMSILSIKFVMNKTVNIIHPKIAHKFPALADVVSDYQGSRNNLTIYGLTPLDATDYADPLDFFNRLLDEMYNFEALLSEALDLSDEEDASTYAFILRFIEQVGKVTEQIILLVDKGTAYKGDWMLFDHNIEDFIIL
jgi:hypothetical protein